MTDGRPFHVNFLRKARSTCTGAAIIDCESAKGLSTAEYRPAKWRARCRRVQRSRHSFGQRSNLFCRRRKTVPSSARRLELSLTLFGSDAHAAESSLPSKEPGCQDKRFLRRSSWARRGLGTPAARALRTRGARREFLRSELWRPAVVKLYAAGLCRFGNGAYEVVRGKASSSFQVRKSLPGARPLGNHGHRGSNGTGG